MRSPLSPGGPWSTALDAGSGFCFFSESSGGAIDSFLAPKSLFAAPPALGDCKPAFCGYSLSSSFYVKIEPTFFVKMFDSVDFSVGSGLRRSKRSGPLAKVSLNVLTSCTLFVLASASDKTAS